MKQLLQMLLFGTVVAFLLGVAVAVLFWRYQNIQLWPQPSLTEIVAPIQVTEPPVDLSTLVKASSEAAVNLAAMQAETQARSLTYQGQITTLQSMIQEREATYQAQLVEANNQLTIYQTAVDQIRQEVEVLNGEIGLLEQQLGDRQTAYQTQLDNAVGQITTRRTELVNQRTTIRQALAEVQASLNP